MVETVNYGNTKIDFSINHSARKSLAIEVHPDLSVNVIAPINTALTDVKEKVLKRAKWISKQRRYFEQFLPRTPQREYVPGETHYYLGRKYLLKIRTAEKNEVKLKGGELVVFTAEKSNKELTKNLLSEWYYHHAKKRFSVCIEQSIEKFGSELIKTKPPLMIKRMSKRWGSCTPKGRIVLNPEIIKTSSKCIEYVVIHELCHLIYPNHSNDFFRLQKKIMPEWEKWKMKLEKTLV